MLLLVGSFLMSQLAVPVHSMPVYGQDDRLDLYQVEDPKLIEWADSTVAFFETKALRYDPSSSRWVIQAENLGQVERLCPGERFADQPAGAFCSGFLVGPDLIATAGHCVRLEEPDCEKGDTECIELLQGPTCVEIRIAFGFAVDSEGALPTGIPATDVYACREVVRRRLQLDGPDWAILRLDRPVQGRQPLTLSRSGGTRKGDPLVVLGHPSGLPLKIAGGAWVRDPQPGGFRFRTNLDTFGHSSGSPVLNARTGLVEGIVVEGDDDFVERGDCQATNVLSDEGGGGEQVVRSSAFADLRRLAEGQGEIEE